MKAHVGQSGLELFFYNLANKSPHLLRYTKEIHPMNDYLSVIFDQFRPLCVRAFYATFCVCLAQEKDSEKKKNN